MVAVRVPFAVQMMLALALAVAATRCAMPLQPAPALGRVVRP